MQCVCVHMSCIYVGTNMCSLREFKPVIDAELRNLKANIHVSIVHLSIKSTEKNTLYYSALPAQR